MEQSKETSSHAPLPPGHGGAVPLVHGGAVPPGHGGAVGYVRPEDPNGWGTALLDNVGKVATWSNNEKTRILVVTPNVENEKKYVQTNLSKNSTVDKMDFQFFEKKGNVQKDEFLKTFKEIGPTVVVLSFPHGITLSPVHYPTGSVVSMLKNEGHFSKILLNSNLYLFMETRNIWHLEDCIVSSMVEVTASGVEDQVVKAVEDKLLENKVTSKALIFSGGHGGPKKNGRVTPAGGVSCFTDKSLVEPQFFKEDKATVELLKKDPRFDKIDFKVINIAEYGNYDGKIKNLVKKLLKKTNHKINKLITELETYRPTYIIVGWCFSSNGDLAMGLRSHGMFSKLLLEHDLRKITQDPQSKLSPQQVKVIKKAALDSKGAIQYQDFHLAGSSGSGKTILGMEIAKMKLAQLWMHGKVKLLVLTQKPEYGGESKELHEKLRADVEQLKELTNAYEIQTETRMLDNSDTVEKLMIKIKEEVSKPGEGVCNTIVFVDEVRIKSTDVDGKKVRDMTSMGNIAPTVHVIYAYSPADWPSPTSFKLELPAITSQLVYSEMLNTRYRNNQHIINFLRLYKDKETLLNPDDEDGASLPLKLPESPNPVLWIECNWEMDDMDRRLTREMARSLVMEMDQWKQYNVMVIHDDMRGSNEEVGEAGSSSHQEQEAGQAWRIVDWGECAGIEEEIVVVIGWRIRYEEVSRARRQLVVIIGKGVFSREKSVLEKAEKQNLLVKRKITDKPGCIKFYD